MEKVLEAKRSHRPVQPASYNDMQSLHALQEIDLYDRIGLLYEVA